MPQFARAFLAFVLLSTVVACPRVSGIPIVGPGVDCATDAVSGHIDLITEITTVLTDPSLDGVLGRLSELAKLYGPEVVACWVDKVTNDSQAPARAGNQNAALRARNGAEWLSRSQAGFARRVR